MTPEQRAAIEKYRAEFNSNCSMYAPWGSKRDCSFQLYKGEKPEDLNYTMVITSVTGLSDDLQTYVETVNLMVEPDGNVINLIDLFDRNQVIDYIQQLKKID